MSILIDKGLECLSCYNVRVLLPYTWEGISILSQCLESLLFEDTYVRHAKLGLIHAKITTPYHLHLRADFRRYQSRLIGPKLLRAASPFRVATESPKLKSFQQPLQWLSTTRTDLLLARQLRPEWWTTLIVIGGFSRIPRFLTEAFFWPGDNGLHPYSVYLTFWIFFSSLACSEAARLESPYSSAGLIDRQT